MTTDPLESLERIKKDHGLVPSGVTIASDKPLQLGQVFIFVGVRYSVTEELSKDEFDKRTAANAKRRLEQEAKAGFRFGPRPGSGSLDTVARGASVTKAAWADNVQPSSDQKYYYVLKRLSGEANPSGHV